jgi:hypothetical protein
MHKKSQKCYISRSCGGGTPGAISVTFGPLVHRVNVINSAKFDHWLGFGEGLNLSFSYASPCGSYNRASANALSVMKSLCLTTMDV